ncbi:MAG: tripartite tricarboxylate transporter permease [Pseudomonadota bacterium]
MLDVLSASADGFLLLFHWRTFLFMMLGISLGMIFGLIPGLSGLSGMSLLLPIAITQPPEIAIAFLLGMYAVTTQTDAIPAVLIGVPGTSAAQATYLDGYPMAKRGEAGRALSASYFASVWGTLVSVFVIILFLPVLRGVIDNFASPEFFMTSLFGLMLAASLVGTSVTRGLIVAFLGLLLSTIGYAEFASEDRFTMNVPYLEAGIPIVPIALGLFALPEVIDMLLSRRSISDKAGKLGPTAGALEGFKDTVRSRWLTFRSGIIGCVAGMIPGLGGTVAEWLSYGHAVQSAKDSSQFGRGDVRGVIAPEAGTAAQKPGAIVPTVALGIPGNASMAVMMGALLIVGLRPGPPMLFEDLHITFQMTWTVVIANLIVAFLCLWLQRYLIKICFVRAEIIAPAIFCFMIVGASMASNSMGDIILFGVFGVVGYIFKHADWPRVPLIIGFVLGGLLENNFWITIRRYDLAFMWERPIVIVMEVLIIAIIASIVISRLRRQKTTVKPAESFED